MDYMNVLKSWPNHSLKPSVICDQASHLFEQNMGKKIGFYLKESILLESE